MKYGLAVFPSLYDSFYHNDRQLLYTQRLEPSVLYVAPRNADCVFIADNRPRADVGVYLCSVYTRGWREFAAFARTVGRERVAAGGYHPTALPHDALAYAHKVVTGYCGDIDRILAAGEGGIFEGTFGFTPLRRDLIDQRTLAQVYPDMRPEYVVGSMVSSVGCPYDCSFCSTPQMSGRTMRLADAAYVEREVADLVARGVNAVLVRDESFATNRAMLDVASRLAGKFDMVYSFGTGNVMGSRPDLLEGLARAGWHSLNFGLEDVGTVWRKNRLLKQATEYCRRHGIQVVLSFIVNDDAKDMTQARAGYRGLYDAFCDLLPSQVCANFMMPMPGTGLWPQYAHRIDESDFAKYDSKTPILCDPSLVSWHKRMIVAVQLKYYYSDIYRDRVRRFECGDTLHRRAEELKGEHGFENHDWDEFMALPATGAATGA